MKTFFILTLILSIQQTNAQHINTTRGVFYYSSVDSVEYSSCGSKIISGMLMFSKSKIELNDSSKISSLTFFLIDCPGDYGSNFFKSNEQYVITYIKGKIKDFKNNLFEYEFFKSKGAKFYKAIKIKKK